MAARTPSIHSSHPADVQDDNFDSLTPAISIKIILHASV
jgi:hypothetical protein